MSDGRTIAIGDIHGCDTALDRLLEQLSPQPSDHFVILGDVCDRGPNTKRVIEKLIELSRTSQLSLILGNHDEMMLGVFGRLSEGDLNFWWSVGGAATIDSYGDPTNIPDSHLDFMESGIPFLETEHEIFVHANLDSHREMVAQSPEILRWKKVTSREAPHISGKRVICGHSSQKSGWPLVWNGWVCIDTMVYDEAGWLTALDVDTNLFYQANQAGQACHPISLNELMA